MAKKPYKNLHTQLGIKSEIKTGENFPRMVSCKAIIVEIERVKVSFIFQLPTNSDKNHCD